MKTLAGDKPLTLPSEKWEIYVVGIPQQTT